MQLSVKFLVISSVLLLSACKQSGQIETSEDTEIDHINSTAFEEFYHKFHMDSAFQMSHITFPLEGKTYNEKSEKINKKWLMEEWVLHKPFDDMGGTFQRQLSSFGEMVSEKISDDNNISSMERRYAIIQGEWHLIYYDPIHLTKE